jgi:hypothetical protein
MNALRAVSRSSSSQSIYRHDLGRRGLRGREAQGSGLESCVKPVRDLTRGDDGDAQMAADGQQVLAVAGDDQLGSGGHGRSNDVIVIGVIGYEARHAGRRDQATSAVYCATSAAMLVPKLSSLLANFA